jgi:hypothetical protein
LRVAQQICDEFGVLSSSVSGVDIELKTEANLRRARTLLAAKQFSQVLNLLAYYSLPNKCLTHLIFHLNFIFSSGLTYSECMFYIQMSFPLLLLLVHQHFNHVGPTIQGKYIFLIVECPCAGSNCGEFSFLYMLQVQHASRECKCSSINR